MDLYEWMNLLSSIVKFNNFSCNRSWRVGLQKLSFTQALSFDRNLSLLDSVRISTGRLFHCFILRGVKLWVPSVDLNLLVSLIPLFTPSLVFIANFCDIRSKRYTGFLSLFVLNNIMRECITINCLTFNHPICNIIEEEDVSQSDLVTSLAARFCKVCRAVMRYSGEPPYSGMR